MPVVPTLQQWRQEDQKFMIIFVESLRTAWTTQNLNSKKKMWEKNLKELRANQGGERPLQQKL